MSTQAVRGFDHLTAAGRGVRNDGSASAVGLKGRREESGQSLIEFALMFTSFMFLMAGIFDFSRGIFYYNSLAEAARAGVRYAIVHGENGSPSAGPCTSGASCSCADGSAPNATAIRTAVLSRTTAMDPGTVTTTCGWPDQNSAGTYLNGINYRISVTVAYTYQPILTAFIPGATITLQGGATSFIQY